MDLPKYIPPPRLSVVLLLIIILFIVGFELLRLIPLPALLLIIILFIVGFDSLVRVMPPPSAVASEGEATEPSSMFLSSTVSVVELIVEVVPLTTKSAMVTVPVNVGLARGAVPLGSEEYPKEVHAVDPSPIL